MENLVRRDAEFAARDRRFENRVRAYGNEDAAGANGLFSFEDADRMGVLDHGAAVDDLDAGSPDSSDKRPRGA